MKDKKGMLFLVFLLVTFFVVFTISMFDLRFGIEFMDIGFKNPMVVDYIVIILSSIVIVKTTMNIIRF